MKVSHGSQNHEMQSDFGAKHGKQPREGGKIAGKPVQGRLTDGYRQQQAFAFENEMRAAQLHAPAAEKTDPEEQEDNPKSQIGAVDISNARLLASTDSVESRNILTSSPTELLANSRLNASEARIEKATAAMVTQIEQAVRSEAAADHSASRVLSLSLDVERFGLSGLTLLTTNSSLSVVLERASVDGMPGDIQTAAQSLLSALQSRFPDRKIRILDRLEQGQSEVEEISTSSLMGISNIFAGQRS